MNAETMCRYYIYLVIIVVIVLIALRIGGKA
jgi:hypothetical protein